MRLLFVHERFGEWAGAEANAAATAAALKDRGHALGLLHGPATGRGEAAWRELFTDRYPLGQGEVWRAIDTFSPDVVYVHKLAALDVLEALVASGVPLVRMVHDHDLYCMRSYKYHFLSRHVCSRPFSPYCVFPCGAVLRRNRRGRWPVAWVSYTAKKRELELHRGFDCLIVASHYMKEELLRNGFTSDQIAIHPPVPPPPKEGPSSNFSDRNRIVYAGQIIRGKGVDILLRALARVTAPWECVILGDGNHRAACERLSQRLGLQRQVHFLGYVAPDQMASYYREASLAVLSSVWPEPFGAVGLEAMRFGLPVVAFDAGGIGEWLLDGINGYLVPWMDQARFAARVTELLGNKALARTLGQRGLEMVSGPFSFDRYLTDLEDLFARVAAESKIVVAA